MMVRAADPVEMLVRQNCASILANRSTALEAPSTSPVQYLLPLDLMNFKCKDCNRRFPTFQALGGHRASHIKLRITDEEPAAALRRRGRFKLHECRECRIRFATGQALGGHMRRHAEFVGAKRKRATATVQVNNFLESFQDLDDSTNKNKMKRVLEFDLNSQPAEEEDASSLQLGLLI